MAAPQAGQRSLPKLVVPQAGQVRRRRNNTCQASRLKAPASRGSRISNRVMPPRTSSRTRPSVPGKSSTRAAKAIQPQGRERFISREARSSLEPGIALQPPLQHRHQLDASPGQQQTEDEPNHHQGCAEHQGQQGHAHNTQQQQGTQGGAKDQGTRLKRTALQRRLEHVAMGSMTPILTPKAHDQANGNSADRLPKLRLARTTAKQCP